MASNNVEMEDAHKPDPGNDITESKDKDLRSAVTVSENADKSENSGDNLNNFSNEAKVQVSAMSELENQTHHENEINDPILVEPVEPPGEQVDTENKDEVVTCTEANVEVQIDSGSIVHKLTDAKTDTESKNEEDISIKANEEVTTDFGIRVRKSTDLKTQMVENSDANDGLKEDPLENVEIVIPVDASGDAVVGKIKDSVQDEDCAKDIPKIDMANKNADSGGNSRECRKLDGFYLTEAPQIQNVTLDEVSQSADKEMFKECATPVIDGNTKTVETVTKLEVNDSSRPNQHGAVTPDSVVRYIPANMGDHSVEADKTVYSHATLPLDGESDDGTPEEQAALMKELESFYRERAMDFKAPKFYGQPLNCLKLWRAVIRLGGYDRVTGSKLWRQVGESFHPPKTCTTVSWTFRIFYEKSLLEYEKYKRSCGDLQLPVAMLPEASGATADSEGNNYQGSGSGRARRDAAARAMQGWHVHRHIDYGEAGDPNTKDKNINNMVKREKNIKSIASLKQKRPNEVEHPIKAARTETSKQLVASVVDIGPPADWVKVKVRQTNDSFEVFVLIPGLLRDEVRVQSDPVGRLVITGQPEQTDNPWGITPFKKVVSLPARIDPLQTSAVVSLHGRLFIRVPFESNS